MKEDIFSEITNNLIQYIESTGKLPWTERSFFSRTPVNLIGKEYNGINFVNLFVQQNQQAWDAPIFGTFKQWNEHGCSVKRGESGNRVVFFSKMYADPQNFEAPFEKEQTETHTKEVFVRKAFTVFNASQVNGEFADRKIAEYNQNLPSVNFEKIEAAEKIWQQYKDKPRLEHSGVQSFYSLKGDYINLGKKETFKREVDYYAELFHEAVHSTGHPSRLNRTPHGAGNDKIAYAQEELVAELGSAFLCKEAHILPKTEQNHSAYLKHYLEQLKEDPKFLFKTMSKAEQASRYVSSPEFAEKKRTEIDINSSRKATKEQQSKNDMPKIAVENLRKQSLIRTMEGLGYAPYYQRDNKAEYRLQDGIKIAVTDGVAADGAGLWHSWKDGRGGAGAIDLVCYLQQCTVHDAIKELAIIHGDNPPEREIVNKQVKSVKISDHLPELVRNEKQIQQAKDYLIQTRGIDPSLVEKLMQENLIQIVESRPIQNKDGSTYTIPNIAFPLRDKNPAKQEGLIIRGVGEKNSFKQNLLISEAEQARFYVGSHLSDARHVVICESPIDLISYIQLKGEGIQNDTHYCSFGGARTSRAENLEISEKTKVTIALDSDDAGKKMTERLKQKFPQAEITYPKSKDFNQDLTAITTQPKITPQ